MESEIIPGCVIFAKRPPATVDTARADAAAVAAATDAPVVVLLDNSDIVVVVLVLLVRCRRG